ncbi:MAG: dTDP-4-dehydrorhamnose reductase [Actinomycetota bacterium]|nr:dTDP-4-dehydrorhamnose reductase [Actinomycetota bacterium]
MRILVTGAGGMLGQDVVRAAVAAGHEPIGLDRRALDVTDRELVQRAVANAGPNAVINCAAWTDVDGAESSPGEADAVNGAGAGHVAQATAEAGALLVHVSTDYVFDGTSISPYTESAPTSPISAYGATKLAGEDAVARAGTEHVIVRSSWLFGAGGGNFVQTMLRLGDERESVAVVTDQTGCPTWTVHLAHALIELAASDRRGVLHVAGDGACSWNEFAVEIFAQAGLSCRVEPATTEEMARPAARPANSVLRSERVAPELPHWRDGLAGYLAARRDTVAPAAKVSP